MIWIEMAVPKNRLNFIYAHRFHCNQFPVEIDHRKYEPGDLQFFATHAALNIKTMLYEGHAIFWEPAEKQIREACQAQIDFGWLLNDLLSITGKGVKYATYNSSTGYDPGRYSGGQSPSQRGCCR